MLSSGANAIIWDKMLSSRANVIMVSSGANVIIWCYHVMLSSGMITHPFFIFPENFTHSYKVFFLSLSVWREEVLPLQSTTTIHQYMLARGGREGQNQFTETSQSSDVFTTTAGAQSIARLCQNLINCRRNIWAHRKRRKLRFFLLERSWAVHWFKILTKVNS